MTALFYLMVAAVAVLLIRLVLLSGQKKGASVRPKRHTRKKVGREVWVQVYDTASLEEAQSLQARLEEEELDCLLYEQGRKDVHGNPLKGFGIAVPRTAVPRAQTIIVRTPS